MKTPKRLQLQNTDALLLLLAALVLIGITSLNIVSDQTITFLQTSNRNSANAYDLKDKMQKLFADVLLMETVQRNNNTNGFNESKDYQAVDQVKTDLKELQPLVYEQITKEYDQLSFFVNRKIKFNTLIIDAYKRGGKSEADAMMNSGVGDQIRDSIYKYASRLELEFGKNVQQNLEANFKKSKSLKPFISILSILSFIAIVGLSIRVVIKMRTKNKLIRKLRISHRRQVKAKKESEVAKKEAESIAILKQNFLANMSHEIRTPINAVIGFSNILQKTRLTKEQKKFVSLIQTSGSSLLSLVNDILDLSKIEAGMVKLESIPFNPVNVANSVHAMFQPQAKEKCIDLFLDVDTQCKKTVMGDPLRLTQVLTNLISNALKFTQKGSVGITVKLEHSTNDKNIFTFMIKDTGIGMSQEQVNKLFIRFDQGENDIARRFGGTGLGLAIVKNLIELQGGSIEVESRQEVGTTFLFQIPFENEIIKLDFESVNDIDENKRFKKDIRLLVVDDNEINLMLLEYMLSDWGIQFDTATNGIEAIEKVIAQKYDLVFMDIQMPVLDGYKTTERIRKELELTIPIVAMTAHVMPEEKEKCRLQGMDDYISKPLQEDALKKIIYKYSGKEIAIKDRPSMEFIDPVMLKKRFSGNMDFVIRIVHKALIQFLEEKEQLEYLNNKQDRSEIEKLAHKMRSTASVFHHESNLVLWLTQLEMRSSEGCDWSEINKLVDMIINSSANLQAEVDSLFKEVNQTALSIS